ncbi:unnamed protein product, partial [Ixodes pacificus]
GYDFTVVDSTLAGSSFKTHCRLRAKGRISRYNYYTTWDSERASGAIWLTTLQWRPFRPLRRRPSSLLCTPTRLAATMLSLLRPLRRLEPMRKWSPSK